MHICENCYAERDERRMRRVGDKEWICLSDGVCEHRARKKRAQMEEVLEALASVWRPWES